MTAGSGLLVVLLLFTVTVVNGRRTKIDALTDCDICDSVVDSMKNTHPCALRYPDFTDFFNLKTCSNAKDTIRSHALQVAELRNPAQKDPVSNAKICEQLFPKMNDDLCEYLLQNMPLDYSGACMISATTEAHILKRCEKMEKSLRRKALVEISLSKQNKEPTRDICSLPVVRKAAKLASSTPCNETERIVKEEAITLQKAPGLLDFGQTKKGNAWKKIEETLQSLKNSIGTVKGHKTELVNNFKIIYDRMGLFLDLIKSNLECGKLVPDHDILIEDVQKDREEHDINKQMVKEFFPGGRSALQTIRSQLDPEECYAFIEDVQTYLTAISSFLREVLFEEMRLYFSELSEIEITLHDYLEHLEKFVKIGMKEMSQLRDQTIDLQLHITHVTILPTERGNKLKKYVGETLMQMMNKQLVNLFDALKKRTAHLDFFEDEVDTITHEIVPFEERTDVMMTTEWCSNTANDGEKYLNRAALERAITTELPKITTQETFTDELFSQLKALRELLLSHKKMAFYFYDEAKKKLARCLPVKRNFDGLALLGELVQKNGLTGDKSSTASLSQKLSVMFEAFFNSLASLPGLESEAMRRMCWAHTQFLNGNEAQYVWGVKLFDFVDSLISSIPEKSRVDALIRHWSNAKSAQQEHWDLARATVLDKTHAKVGPLEKATTSSTKDEQSQGYLNGLAAFAQEKVHSKLFAVGCLTVRPLFTRGMSANVRKEILELFRDNLFSKLTKFVDAVSKSITTTTDDIRRATDLIRDHGQVLLESVMIVTEYDKEHPEVL